jgi:thiol-disulfide isomerase/thioredoxin
MMKRFAQLSLLMSLLVGGVGVWQLAQTPPPGNEQDLAADKNSSDSSGWLTLLVQDAKGWLRDRAISNSADATTVSLRGQSITNPYLERSRSELNSFRSFPLDFDVMTIDGKPLQKDDFAGRVLIVDIWATWCPPCRAEIPSFVELQSKYFDAGLSIIGMNYERAGTPRDAIRAINEFRRLQPINYPLALGTESLTAQVPRFRGYPTTLFIDASGEVRMKLVGAHPLEVLESYALVLLSETDQPAESPAGAKPPRELPTALKPGISSGPALHENPYANPQSI